MNEFHRRLGFHVAIVVLMASTDGDLSRCVADDDQEPVVLGDHFGTVGAVAFSPDGKMLVTGDGNFGKGSGLVRVWDVGPSWTRRDGSFRHSNKITSLAFSPDGKLLATASLAEFLRPPELYIRDLEKHQIETPLDNEVFATWCVAFSPDGKFLASGHETSHVKLWDVASRTLIATLKGHENRVRSVAFSPDGKRLASASDDGTIKFWNVGDRRKEIALLKEDDFYATCVAFAPAGNLLAAGGGVYDQNAKEWTSGGVKYWNVATGKVESDVKGHAQPVRSIVFDPRGVWLATAGGSGVGKTGEFPGVLKLTIVADGTERKLVKLPVGISSLALSPDKKFLAAGCDDGTARVWDVSGTRTAK